MKVNILPIKILSTLLLLGSIYGTADAAYWVDNPAGCPQTDGVNYPGINCVPNNICGDISGTPQCFDTSLMSPVTSATTNTQVTASLGGGYIIDCYATADTLAPFCDNDGNFWCNRDDSCFSTQHRSTICSSGNFGSFTCGTCNNGYNDCDGDGNVCEIFAIDGDDSSTVFPGVSNAVYNTSCTASCKTTHMSCDGTGGTNAPNDANGCETEKNTDPFYINGGNNVTYANSCNTSTCSSGHIDCDGATDGRISGDGSSSGDPDGCEIQVGVTACTTSGGMPGIYDQPNTCTCTETAPADFWTGGNQFNGIFNISAATYQTSNPLLWGKQLGTGELLKFGNSGSDDVFRVNNDGAIFVNGNPLSSSSGSPDSIWDIDLDTGIQVEETADEDMIRFDTEGKEILTIDSSGMDITDGIIRLNSDSQDPQLILEGQDMGRRWVIGQDEADNIGSTGLYFAEGTNVSADNALLYLSPDGSLSLGRPYNDTQFHIYSEGDNLSKSHASITRFSDTPQNGSIISLIKSRGTRLSQSAIQSGDTVGTLQFGGQYSGSYNALNYGALIRASATENWSTTNQGMQLVFSNNPNASTTDIDRLVIEQDGTLTVGNTNDYENLVLSDDDIPNKKYIDDTVTANTITAGNGLTKNGGTIKLGGDLNENTYINHLGFSLIIREFTGETETEFNGDNFKIKDYKNNREVRLGISSADNAGLSFMGLNNHNLYYRDNTVLVDSNAAGFTGIEYGNDYSANYSNRSLVDKAYVDSHIGDSIWDIDLDTGIQVEETTDEDMIHFDIGNISGTAHPDAMVINRDGFVGVGTPTPDYPLDVAGNIGIDGYTYHNNDTNTYTYFTPDRWQLFTGGRSMIDAQYSDKEITINEESTETDFRIESGHESHLFFTDGSENRIGIANANPGALLDIKSGENTEFIRLTDSTNTDYVGLLTGKSNPEGTVIAQQGSIYLNSSSGSLYIKKTGDGLNTGWVEAGVASSGGTSIWDLDSDTGIQVEKNADDDTLRFDLGGSSIIQNVLTINQANGFVWNSGNDNLDFALNGSTNNNIFLLDADNNSVAIGGPMAYSPSSDQDIDAGTEIIPTHTYMKIQGDGGATTITATPSIASGQAGQILILQGISDTNLVTLQDEDNLTGSGLQLSGGINFTLGKGDTIYLIFDSTDSVWYELSRSDN